MISVFYMECPALSAQMAYCSRRNLPNVTWEEVLQPGIKLARVLEKHDFQPCLINHKLLHVA